MHCTVCATTRMKLLCTVQAGKGPVLHNLTPHPCFV